MVRGKLFITTIILISKIGGKMNLSVKMAASKARLTSQGIMVAVKSGRLKAKRGEKGKWTISLKDLKDYQDSRYCRSFSKKSNGQPLFDNDKGFYSVPQISKISGITTQRIYYLIRKGKLKSKKYEWSYIIDIKEFEKVKKTERRKRFQKK